MKRDWTSDFGTWREVEGRMRFTPHPPGGAAASGASAQQPLGDDRIAEMEEQLGFEMARLEAWRERAEKAEAKVAAEARSLDRAHRAEAQVAKLTAKLQKVEAERDELAGLCKRAVEKAEQIEERWSAEVSAEVAHANKWAEACHQADHALNAAWKATGVEGAVRGLTTLADVVTVNRVARNELEAERDHLREDLEHLRAGIRELLEKHGENGVIERNKS